MESIVTSDQGDINSALGHLSRTQAIKKQKTKLLLDDRLPTSPRSQQSSAILVFLDCISVAEEPNLI